MKKILLIEDDVHMQSLLSTLFERHGYEVDAVFDGEDAKKLFEGYDYNVVVSDVYLPDTDAACLIADFRSSRDNFSVFVISGGDRAGTGDKDVFDKIEKLGVTGLYYKPFDHEALMKDIQAAL